MATSTGTDICWDTSCFIAYFDPNSADHQVCNGIVEAAKSGKLKLCTSMVTLVEVLKVPGLYPTEADDTIQRFFRHRYIILVNLDYEVARIARDLRRRFGLTGLDAIHLATAVHAKAAELQTTDNDLLKLDSQIPGVTLRIREPTYQFQLRLPTPSVTPTGMTPQE